MARAIRMERHTHHHRVGLPFAHPRLRGLQARLALGLDRRLGRGGAQQAIAHGNPGAPGAEIES
jgi:hypothetical protein